MDILDLDTQVTGYSVSFESDISSEITSPANLFARFNVNEPVSVSVLWDLDSDQYEYFRDVYRTIENNGGMPFGINLIIDTPVAELYNAKFVPGSVQVQILDFGFSVSAELVAIRTFKIAALPDYPVL